MVEALDIWVKGVVQGVGFRPFVYRMAKKYLINGWVMNGVDGVHIHAEGESNLLDEFVLELSDNAPAAAQVTEIEMHEVPLEPFDKFEIRTSDDAHANRPTLVSPDLATCADCERELFDESDRRFRYPFINCTNCGPRFTIIDKLPYDRCNTSMLKFEMCANCQAEYDNPTDRRFHAQPDSCFECGPALTFMINNQQPEVCAEASALEIDGAPLRPGQLFVAKTREQTDAIFAEAVRMLLDGKILAVKGLGGFHLVCDANNSQAVQTLRRRKQRDGKPLAVMLPTLVDVHKICHIDKPEAALLQGSVRPIVLLRKRQGVNFVEGLADKLSELGVMLPYTPVQHILLHDFAEALALKSAHCNAPESVLDNAEGAVASSCKDAEGMPPMLVMTSGNIHDEPIVTNDEEAFKQLGGIADAFIGNNRAIVSRFDDSVLRVIRAADSDAIQFIRRARGYAPAPLELKLDFAAAGEASAEAGSDASRDTIFATGAAQKDTFAFLRPANDAPGVGASAANPKKHQAFVSQHIGDMENAQTFDAWLEAKSRYCELFDLQAQSLACDMHPEYLTSKWAEEQAALAKPPMPLTKVQHHHAHIVSALAENGIPHAACGIAFDGTGYGADGNIWGGEVLISNLVDFERFINFAYVPMPGGQAAIKNPLRMAYGVLWEFDLLEHPAAASALEALGQDQAELCAKMIEQGLNTPVTSSVGRLFDAASALLGVCTHPAYEGEAAILLEAALWESAQAEGANAELAADSSDAYIIDVIKNTATDTSTAHDTSVFLFDAAPAFARLLDDKEAGVDVGTIARRFHDAFVVAVVQASQLCNAMYGISDVVLTGGVFMNRYLIEHAITELTGAGFNVVLNRELPPNDGCISLGQAVVGVGARL